VNHVESISFAENGYETVAMEPLIEKKIPLEKEKEEIDEEIVESKWYGSS
jgi:hypothetical protein